MNKTHYGSSAAAITLGEILENQPHTRKRLDRLLNIYNKNLNDVLLSSLDISLKQWVLTSLLHDMQEKVFKSFSPPEASFIQNVVRARYRAVYGRVNINS